ALMFIMGLMLLSFISIWHSIIYNYAAYNLTFTFFNSSIFTKMFYWLEWQGIGHAISYGFCLLALLYGSPRLKRPFEWPVLHWVGLISFSLYLWHLPLMIRIANTISYKMRGESSLVQYGALCCWTLALILPLSVILYRWIEMPGIHMGERLIQKLDGQKKSQLLPVKVVSLLSVGTERDKHNSQKLPNGPNMISQASSH